MDSHSAIVLSSHFQSSYAPKYHTCLIINSDSLVSSRPLVLHFDKTAASHNWWKFDLAVSYPLLPSQSIPLSYQHFLQEFQSDWFQFQCL